MQDSKSTAPGSRAEGIILRYRTPGLAALAAGLMLTASAFAAPVYAGDLGSAGGACCSDLEERIAELEATTAKKGNRKVSLRVYGVVDEAIMHLDGDLGDKWAVGQNANVESFVGIAGEAVITPHISAGYVLEIGIGSDDDRFGLSSPFNNSATGTYTRRSFGYVKHDTLGAVSVGLVNQATDGVAEMSVANTQVAARMLSLKPLIGPNVGDVLDLFDGTRTNAVRYDSATFAGAQLSASWAAGGIAGQNTGDVWDIALRWAGEGNGFKAAAGIGYRQGIAVPGYGNLGSISSPGGTEIDPRVISGSASIKHIASGLFLNGAVGNFEVGGALGHVVSDFTMWTLQGGIEQKFVPLGATTLYAEYADSSTLKLMSFPAFGLSYWGLGAVQHLEAVNSDLYVSYRRYDADVFDVSGDIGLFMAGVRVNF